MNEIIMKNQGNLDKDNYKENTIKSESIINDKKKILEFLSAKKFKYIIQFQLIPQIIHA